ncbi:MAG: rhomboid family intramembrane serine protease [Terriglobales bacterium]
MDFEKGMALLPVLTLVLIVANVLIFTITLFRGALESVEGILLAGALAKDAVLAGEIWRPVTAMFLHASFGHLVGNVIALYILGIACEHAYGLAKFGVLYFLAGLGGAVLSLAFATDPSVGASGAIFGLMGAGIVFFRKYGHHFFLRDNRVGVVLLVWAAYSILTAFWEPYIDNAAHIGGLVTGAALAWLMRPVLIERMQLSN